jgi:nicotinate-nucleotide--dimethylbenzimidazole phosphoribosyltransferase
MSAFASPTHLGQDPAAEARTEMDRKVKPLGALGLLEDWAVQLAHLQGTSRPRGDPARLLVFAADHGVVDEGISAYPGEVTAAMVRTFATGGAALTVLGQASGIPVEVVDVGVASPDRPPPGVLDRRVRAGTSNLAEEPAMTEEETNAAIEVGRERARAAASLGVRALGLGEMGIGNTTSAAALVAAVTGTPAAQIVGRGTGVDDTGLARKQRVVERALRRHAAAFEPGDILRCMGGLELAAIAGVCLEARALGLAIMIDGFPATAAALIATRLAPEVREALFFSHRSAVLGHAVALGALAGRPLLDAGLRLGEASGAALALPILARAADLLRDMATFESAEVPGREP